MKVFIPACNMESRLRNKEMLFCCVSAVWGRWDAAVLGLGGRKRGGFAPIPTLLSHAAFLSSTSGCTHSIFTGFVAVGLGWCVCKHAALSAHT